MEITVREPRPSEAPACALLLPELHNDPFDRVFQIAVDTAGCIAGAISFRDSGDSISGLRLHVTPSRRRAGIGTRLLNAAADYADVAGRGKLIAAADIQRESGAEEFLTGRNFQLVSRLTVVEGELDQLRKSWLTNRARIPPGTLPASARFVGIGAAPMGQLVRMHAEHITHTTVVPGLQRVLRLDRFKESVILMVGDQIAGAILAEITDGLLSVPAWIVAPEYRGKYIGALMRAALLDRVMDRVTGIRFEYFERATATARVTREAGYSIVRILAHFERTLSGDAQGRTEIRTPASA